MAIETGKNWKFYLNTQTVASPTWTLVPYQKDGGVNIQQNTIDTTNKSNSGWTTMVPSTRNLDASFSIMYDKTEATHAAIMSAALNQTEKHWKLIGESLENWIFLAYVSMDVGAPVDGVAEVSVTLHRSGTPTYSAS